MGASMPPLLCGHRQRSCDSPPTGTFAGDITAVLACPHPLRSCGHCHRRQGRIFRTGLSCRPRPLRLGGALQRRMRFGTLHAGRISRHRRPNALSAAAFDIPRQAIGAPLMRFISLQRFPAGAALCGVATLTRSRFDVVHLHSGSSLRFFAHDRILNRPALRVAGQFLAGRCRWGRLSLRPPLTRVIRRLLSSA